ncbi:hypothetical protein XaraCFBP7407_22460, partial [Xanthomonas arboricola pv. arracaciae]
WMPRKSLQGRTCGVSCEGGRARALQQSHTAPALQLIYPQSRTALRHVPRWWAGKDPAAKPHRTGSTADPSAKP